MGYIFIDREDEQSQSKMRQQMRRNMRSGGYHDSGSTQMRGNYNEGYRMGYAHGWQDKEDEWDDEDMEYRRRRDSRGRYA